MKRKTFWLMLFVLVLGTILRLVFINKPEGLWNDEYVSWSIAVIPLGKNFIDAVWAQCHMPFYYLYLKLFIHFFGNSDLILRLTSILPGILSIIVMYFVGKEFKDERLGLLSASITVLSSFLIYYSQEVRFYELLFLFAALALLFTLRLGKKQSALNLILYIIINFLIVVTHTIGFVFVFFNLIFMSLLLGRQECYKKKILSVWVGIFFISMLCLPLIYKLFTSNPLSQWWSDFSLSKIGFLFTDYFSPILVNLVSAPKNFFYDFSFSFVVFAIVPSMIAFAGLVNSIKTKKYEIVGLLFASLGFVLVMLVMSISGKLVFITKYSIEIYPILILAVGFGLLEFKKGWRTALIFLFCFLNLFYIIAYPDSAPKKHRAEGHKIVAELLNRADLKQGDVILLNYYPKDRFEKYFNFDKYQVFSINKGTFPEYLGVNSKEEFKTIDNKVFDKKFGLDIIDKLDEKHGKGKKLAIVLLNSVAMYSPVQIQVLLNNDKLYKEVPFLFLVFSHLKNREIEMGMKSLRISRYEQKGSWAVVTFEGK